MSCVYSNSNHTAPFASSSVTLPAMSIGAETQQQHKWKQHILYSSFFYRFRILTRKKMAGEAGTALAIEVIKSVTKPAIEASARHFGYLVHYKSNIDNLNKRAEELNTTRLDALKFLESCGDNNEETTQTNTAWLESAKAVDKAAKSIKEATEKQKMGCLSNCYPNPLERYLLSKKAANKAEEIRQLQNKGKAYVTSTTRATPPSKLPGALANHASEGFYTRGRIMNEIMEALRNDQISIIGLCGLGGVGKTTLMHELRETARVEGLFHEVALATVSQNPDMSNIQCKLAETLGLTRVKELKNEIAIADELRKRLTRGRTLVILDDLWSEIKLEELGIPVKRDQTQCKVVLTSRQVGVCTQMNAHKIIRVDTMPPEEAWHLFQKTAGNCIQSDLEKIAKHVAAECGGLPIALVTLAKALSSKKNIETWKDALKQLQGHNGTRIRGMENKVYMSIKLSIEFLASELPEVMPLLLLCCQHREDAEVKVEMLARYCLALQLLENVDKLDEARNRVSSLTEHLRDCFLLEEEIDFYGMKVVKLHDVVRDVGLSILSGAKEERDRVYMKTRLQVTNEADDYSNLKILVTRSHRGLLTKSFLSQMEELRVLDYSPKFEDLELPAVEVLTNLRMLSANEAELNEDILSKIGRLTKMEILSFRVYNTGPFPRQIVQLNNLKLLDLRPINADRRHPIPRGILPELNKLEDLYLGKYYFPGTPEEGENNGRIEELETLSNLTTLQIQLLNPVELLDLKHFRFDNLQRFSFGMLGSIERFPESIGRSLEFKGLSKGWILADKNQSIVRRTEELVLRRIDDLTDPLILKKFESLKDLTLGKCEHLEYLIPDDVAYMTGSNLVSLCLHSMSGLTELCLNGNLPAGFLGKLRWLSLYDMAKMRHLWLGPTDSLCLVNLRYVSIKNCGALEYIFPHSAIKCLDQLERLEVHNCRMLEGIVSKGDHETTIDLKPHFPKLKRLDIMGLSNLRGFYDGDSRLQPPFHLLVLLPSIEDLWVGGLDQLKQLVGCETPDMIPYFTTSNCVLQTILVMSCNSLESVFDYEGLEVMGEDTHPILGELKEITLCDLPKLVHVCCLLPKEIHIFQNLRELKVKNCGNLSYLFPSSVAQMLVNLVSLNIEGCKSMEECITMNEDNSGKKIVFPSLKSIELTNLEKMSSFCSSDQLEFEFPSVEKVSIIDCLEMKTFCYGGAVVQKLHGVKFVSDYSDKLKWKSDLNQTIQYFNKVPMKILELCGSGQCKLIEARGTTIEFPNTQLLEDVLSCDSSESLFEIGGQELELEEIRLSELHNLTHFWHCRMLDISIPEPQTITVDDSTKLWNLVALKLLQRVNKVVLSCCESLEAVFDFEGLEVTGESSLFGELQNIVLKNLPKLEHICRMAPKEIHVFQNLSSLSLSYCGSLSYVFSSSMAQMLEKLEWLEISFCESMKEVLTMNEVYDDRKKIVFRFLYFLSLRKLEKLSSFCSSDQLEFDFPSLQRVFIDDCPEMKTFCYGRLTEKWLFGVHFSFNDGKTNWKSDLNQTIQHYYASYNAENVDDIQADKEGTSSPDTSLASLSSPALIEYVPSASTEHPVPSSDPKENDFAAAVVENVEGPDAGVDDLNVTANGDGDENVHSDNEVFDRGDMSTISTQLEQTAPPKMPNVSAQTNGSPPSEMCSIAATESSLDLSDTYMQTKTKTEKALPDPLSCSDDQKRSRILIQGVYVEAKMTTTFEEILTANPNFLSAIRVKTTAFKTTLVETAINCRQIIRQGGMSSEQLVYVMDSLVDLAACGLDVAWIQRLCQRESLVMDDEQKVVLAEAELARLERETAEDKDAFQVAMEKLEASKALRDACKAKIDALKKGLEVRKDGGGFDSKRSCTSSDPMKASLAPFIAPYTGSLVRHINASLMNSDHLKEVGSAVADDDATVPNNVDGSSTTYRVVDDLHILGAGDGDENVECDNESQVSHVEAITSEGMDDSGLSNISKPFIEFQEFRIVVNDCVIDSELSKDLQAKYYELCCNRKSYLHHGLLKGINHTLAAVIISEAINIADAIRTSNLSTSLSQFATWDKTLEAFELLGMDVGFLRARLNRLVIYAEARCERDRVEEEEVRTLELKLNEAKSRLEKEMESLKGNAKRYEIMFQEEATASW